LLMTIKRTWVNNRKLQICVGARDREKFQAGMLYDRA
jgi:hypothetical protein